jgi:cell division protein FtsN
MNLPPAIVKPQMPDPANGKVYRVQVGSFEDTRNAKNAFDRVALARFQPAYETFENYYRVVITKVKSSDMREVARWLGYAGFKEIFIREE